MDKVVAFCARQAEHPLQPAELLRARSQPLDGWELEFVSVPPAMLLELIKVANFLSITPMVELACRAVAAVTLDGRAAPGYNNILQGFTPVNWNSATDPNGRSYWWHVITKAVQWMKPQRTQDNATGTVAVAVDGATGTAAVAGDFEKWLEDYEPEIMASCVNPIIEALARQRPGPGVTFTHLKGDINVSEGGRCVTTNKDDPL